jgi:hypothetical protein
VGSESLIPVYVELELHIRAAAVTSRRRLLHLLWPVALMGDGSLHVKGLTTIVPDSRRTIRVPPRDEATAEDAMPKLRQQTPTSTCFTQHDSSKPVPNIPAHCNPTIFNVNI